MDEVQETNYTDYNTIVRNLQTSTNLNSARFITVNIGPQESIFQIEASITGRYSHITTDYNMIAEVGVAITLQDCIREVPGSKLSRRTTCIDWGIRGFPQNSTQCLKYVYY
jgi:hypothetical protein